jgi:signal transduction histidine kinase
MANNKQMRPARPVMVKSGPARSILRALLDTSFDGMLIVNRSQRIVEANVRASRQLGVPLRDMIGKRLRDFARVQRRSVLREGAVIPGLSRAAVTCLTLRRRDNTVVNVIVRDVPEIAPNARLHILRELVAESPVVEALERKTRLLDEAGRIGRIGAWEVDVAAGVLVRAPELCRMMEFAAADHTVTVEQSYSHYTEASRIIVREAFAATLARGTPYDLELEVVTGRGRRIWVREICRATMRKGRLVSVIGLTQDITDRRRVGELLANNANLERARIGADLHDGLGQDLTGLALLLRSAATRAETGAPGLARELGELATLASKAVKTARAMAHGMLSVDLSDGGFAGALRRLSRSTAEAFAVTVTIRLRGHERHRPDGSAAEHLYRIAQEAISNAVKHGHPSRVSLQLHASESQTVLIVSNNGTRIDPNRATEGMGLQIMRHRARVLGGLLVIEPMRRAGTQVRCVVPRVAPG